MKEFLKYVGVLIVIIGALLLIVPALTQSLTNSIMIVAGIMLVVGFVAHILVNKFVAR